jgi:hypothetical protein
VWLRDLCAGLSWSRWNHDNPALQEVPYIYDISRLRVKLHIHVCLMHRFLVGARFSPHVQTDHETHPASYINSTGSFPGGKAAETWRLPPTPFSADVKERVDLYLCSPSGSSWPMIE